MSDPSASSETLDPNSLEISTSEGNSGSASGFERFYVPPLGRGLVTGNYAGGARVLHTAVRYSV